MNIDLRYPQIQGNTEAEQLVQVKSYLHQLVEQLNWALNTVQAAQGGESAPVAYQQKEPSTAQEAEDTFNSIKALIIKSADIVKAYEQTIRTDFDGYYVAESDFGTYVEQTKAIIDANSKGVTEHYENIQQINDELRETNAYIRRGHLYYDDSGKSVVGIEIGETSDGGSFRQYARFTAERLTFFDVNGRPVAYIGAKDGDKSDTNCLYITGKAVFQGAVQFGTYKMDTHDGLAFTWIG